MSIEKDFTKDNLPHNRKEAVIRLLKYRRSTLFSLLFLSFSFSIPLFFWIIFSRYFLYDSIPSDHIFMYIAIRDFPYFFFIFFFAAGLSGIYYVTRRMLFGMSVNVRFHFFRGIKDSGFEFGLFSLIFMIVYALFDVFTLYLQSISLSVPLYILIYMIAVFVLIICGLILFYVFSSSSLYIVSFFTAYKDAFHFSFNGFIKNISLYLLSSLFYLFLIPSSGNVSLIINSIGVLFLVLGGEVLQILIMSARVYTQFDESINKQEYPSYYRAGLMKEDENETLR